MRTDVVTEGQGRRPLVIGLTGPIAAGKSTVADLLRERGAAIIDADEVYRSLLTNGSGPWKQIVERFGPSVLRSDEQIDRAALAAVVFRDASALADLERITHPAVVGEIRRRIAESDCETVVVEAVKLTQAGLLADVESLWLVTADAETRLRRLVLRNGLGEEQARARLAASADLTIPDDSIDVIIENSGTMVETREAVDRAWRSAAEHVKNRDRTACVSRAGAEEAT